MSRYHILLTGLMFTFLGMLGCNKKEAVQAPATETKVDVNDLVAVIDLNLVAQEIGAQAKIDVSVNEREEAFSKQLNGLKEELGRRVEELQSTVATDSDEESKTKLQTLIRDNNNKLALQSQAFQTQLLGHRAQLQQKLLNDIRPVAYNIAQAKGMQIVLTVGQVYAAGPNVDITQDVIKRIKEINDSTATSQPTKGPVAHSAALPGGGEFVPR